MFDENKHTHPQNNDEGPRHIHRGIKRSEPDEVEVDSADFFSPEPPRPKAPPKPTPTPPSEPPKPPAPASLPPLTTNFRKEEWSCWYCRPS